MDCDPPPLTEDQKKAAQAAYTAEAPARLEAQRERERWRRRLTERVSDADRQVAAFVTRAQQGAMTDDELDEYVAAHGRATALRSLENRVARGDEQAAEATRRQILTMPGLDRI